MKILLIGYGKMGKLIEQELLVNGHHLSGILDAEDEWPQFSQAELPDMAIEFTEPSAVFLNIEKCMKAGIPMITGTTGWHNRLEDARLLCEEMNGSLLYASNFSIGVNLWFDLIRDASRRFADLYSYTPSLQEKHHKQKKDAPSGTAVTAAEAFLSENKRFEGWSFDKKENALMVEAIREGDVKGFHELRFQSSFDRISVSHEAFSREGFVQGAVKAAEWLNGEKGFFDFHEVYDKVFNLNNIRE